MKAFRCDRSNHALKLYLGLMWQHALSFLFLVSENTKLFRIPLRELLTNKVHLGTRHVWPFLKSSAFLSPGSHTPVFSKQGLSMLHVIFI